jgi:hypothetical protein
MKREVMKNKSDRMESFTEIAERYGVDPADDEAVDKWFEEIFPTLSDEDRGMIVDFFLDK